MIVLSVFNKKESHPECMFIVKDFSVFKDDEAYTTYIQGIMPDDVPDVVPNSHFNYPIDLYTHYFTASQF